MKKPMVHYQAFAKVNLSLKVGNSMDNGMHPILSKMTQIAFFDELEVTRLDTYALSRYAIIWNENAPVKSEIDWSVTSDLAVRAHRLLEAKIGTTLPVQMKIEKQIPVGGGLGGGSADAAAMLQAVKEIYSLDVDLDEIAMTLGSDVPFFLNGGACIVRGTGNEIEPITLETIHLVLIIPEYGCSTEDVYREFDSLAEPKSNGTNDLLAPACVVEERLSTDINLLQTLTGHEIHISGSGSTMFIICDNEKSATTLARKIEENTNLVAIATHTC
jgi:4-diphosphocytidyl-2-C-methyl-D-erythritol kinase|tara:strand:- start:2795 stop:3613 length:819 start_codon:yes stop_codon:yes gene_type:complete